MAGEKILISSTNDRTGKTSFIYSASQILELSFRYEKPTGISALERKIIRSNENARLTVIEGGRKYKLGLSKNEGDTRIKADKTILIARYTNDVFDEIALASRVLPKLTGAIINEVPRDKLTELEFEALDSNLKILGAIPFDRFLGGIYVKTVKECLNGEFLTKPDENIVMEEMLVGTMSPSCAIDWLKKVRNAGLITGGDRVDLQKLALDTGIKCLILTGNFEPPQIIVKRAEELGVCIILTESDTLTAVEKISHIVRGEINEHKKGRVLEIFRENVDWDAVQEILGY